MDMNVEQRAEMEVALEAPDRPIESKPTSTDGQETKSLRAGDLCPRCQQGRLDYDGLLNLACSRCEYALGGCFT